MGRLKMARWFGMREPDFAREVEKLEKDPLFVKLAGGLPGRPPAIRRQPWPRSRFAGGLYDFDEGRLSRGERVDVEEMMAKRAALLPKIRRMGVEAFEKHFLYGEDALPLEEIARRTGLSLEEVREIHEFLLEVGAKAEFFTATREPVRGYTCLAKISVQAPKPEFAFNAPYWARGLYHVRYDDIEKLKGEGGLTGRERTRLRGLLKKIETLNLRQNTLFRILEAVTGLQEAYLKRGQDAPLLPISLRKLSQRLGLAPSTVSRALSGRSVGLPWGKEVPLIRLLPGRRRVLRELIGRFLEEPGPRPTDARIAERLLAEHRIRVARRTVNAVRREILPADDARRGPGTKTRP